jgi:hypothetical protein
MRIVSVVIYERIAFAYSFAITVNCEKRKIVYMFLLLDIILKKQWQNCTFVFEFFDVCKYLSLILKAQYVLLMLQFLFLNFVLYLVRVSKNTQLTYTWNLFCFFYSVGNKYK